MRSGRLSVSASYGKAGKQAPPNLVKIDFAGLGFEISSAKPAYIRTAEGGRTVLQPQSVEKIPGGARIVFVGGEELRVLEGSSPGLAFRLVASNPRAQGMSLSLRYSLANRLAFSTKDGQSLLTAPGGPYALALQSSRFGENGTLDLLFADGTSSGLALGRIAPQKATESSAAALVAVKAPARLDADVYKADIDAWLAKAWTGLSLGRWDGDRLAWKDENGAFAFSEAALVSYLSESLRRGSYPEAIARMRKTVANYPASLTYLSTPFFGKTVERMDLRERQDVEESARIAALVQAKDSSFLEKEGLVRYLLDRAPAALSADALRFVAEIDPAKLSFKGALCYLRAALEAKSLLADADNPFTGGAAAAARLAASLAKNTTGYFLTTEDDGGVDTRLCLEAGLLLFSYGDKASDDGLAGIGQNVVATLLSLADDFGFLPDHLVLHGDGPSDKTGSVAPEEVYALVSANPYYPHEVSLYRELGAGVWIWTASPSVSLTTGSVSSVFTAAFPAGYTHYMVIYGTKAFSNIKLYGIDYSPDGAFESYDVSGYLYRKASNGLYLKMKHKLDAEKIELDY